MRSVIQLFFPDVGNMTITDEAKVRISSRLLEISEFRLFHIAYSRWYGMEIPDREIEPTFSAYLLENRIPHWVRHFTREVLSRYRDGTLDPGDYDLPGILAPCEMKGPVSALPAVMTICYLFFYLVFSGNITVR